MRNFLIFLFFVTFSFFAQDTIPATKSVVALDKMNVVYRGVSNPISIVVEEHVFRIKGLPTPIGTLNGEYSTKGNLIFTLEEMKEAKIGIKYIDLLFDVKYEVTQFSIKISRLDTIIIDGNIISDDILELLKKVKKDDYILIRDIKTNYMFGDGLHKSIKPIIFQIIQ